MLRGCWTQNVAQAARRAAQHTARSGADGGGESSLTSCHRRSLRGRDRMVFYFYPR